MQNLDQLKTLAADLPEAAKANALALLDRMGAVIEGIGDDVQVWRPPYMRLVQGTTDRGSIPKGTAIGDFVLGEERLEKPLKFIPLRLWHGRQYWDPDQTSSRQLCQSPDAKVGYIGAECRTCQFSKWVEGEGSPCGKIISVLAMTADLGQLFSLTFAKSGYKVGMELESILKKAGVDPYARTYLLDSETSSTAKNVELYKIGILPQAERVTDPALIPFLKELFRQIGADRKASLDAFYESIAQRRAAGLLQIQQVSAPALSDGTTPASEGSVQEVQVEEAVEVSSKAKGYKV